MKRILLIALTILACYGLIAVPAAPFLTTYTQADGSTLEIYVRGDERLNWTESSDGYTLLSKNKSKYYAVKDVDGDLVVSDIQANDPANRTPEELIFLNTIPKYLRYSQTQVNLANEIRNTRLGGFPTTGVNNMVVILANFTDTNPSYSQTNFDNMMNQNNYSGIGSFKQYYLEVSYGQLTVNTTVVGWVTVPNNHDYYGPESRWAEFARDAVYAADPEVDYSQFDNDGDGRVDGVAIYHQGKGQETTGDTSDIWSHSFTLLGGGYFVNLDGVQITDYTMQAEKQYWSMSGIGVICHEFGHNLGTPDFYDTDYQTGGSQDGTGEWDIMGSGAYNGGGDRPAHHNMWSKAFYGWVQPQELYYDGNISIPSSTTNPIAYYFTTPVDGEYIMLENVQQSGFNASVPGNGLLVYHADENWIQSHLNQNNINTTSHQGFYVYPAQGGVNSSSATFPTYSITSLTDNSYPSIPSWGNYDVSKSLTNISKSGGVVSFDFADNSAYIPEVTMTNLMNNRCFMLGEEINLDLTIESSILDVSMVEIFVNGTTEYVHVAEPYNYTMEASFEHNSISDNSDPNEVMVRAYSGSNIYDSYFYFNVITDEQTYLDQFEEYADFSLSFGEWELIDNDNQETKYLPYYDYPNQTSPKSFMIFNPEETTPYIREIEAYSGSKMVASFSNSSDVPNDDWLISPEISLAVVIDEYDWDMLVKLNVLGTSEPGELFNVLYSTAETDYEEFMAFNDVPIEAEEDWNNLSFMLPSASIATKIAIQVVSTGGMFVMVDDITASVVLAVSNEENEVITPNLLTASNYPNPFNPETTISFDMPKAGKANISIFNLKGQLVKTILNDEVAIGNHNIVWEGRDSQNRAVASGIYFFRVKTDTQTTQKKMILMK